MLGPQLLQVLLDHSALEVFLLLAVKRHVQPDAVIVQLVGAEALGKVYRPQQVVLLPPAFHWRYRIVLSIFHLVTTMRSALPQEAVRQVLVRARKLPQLLRLVLPLQQSLDSRHRILEAVLGAASTMALLCYPDVDGLVLVGQI